MSPFSDQITIPNQAITERTWYNCIPLGRTYADASPVFGCSMQFQITFDQRALYSIVLFLYISDPATIQHTYFFRFHACLPLDPVLFWNQSQVLLPHMVRHAVAMGAYAWMPSWRSSACNTGCRNWNGKTPNCGHGWRRLAHAPLHRTMATVPHSPGRRHPQTRRARQTPVPAPPICPHQHATPQARRPARPALPASPAPVLPPRKSVCFAPCSAAAPTPMPCAGTVKKRRKAATARSVRERARPLRQMPKPCAAPAGRCGHLPSPGRTGRTGARCHRSVPDAARRDLLSAGAGLR